MLINLNRYSALTYWYNFSARHFYYFISTRNNIDVSYIFYFVSDIDTDELDSDDKNVQVEKVEFLVKEEVTVID